jgi:hypothetical protein
MQWILNLKTTLRQFLDGREDGALFDFAGDGAKNKTTVNYKEWEDMPGVSLSNLIDGLAEVRIPCNTYKLTATRWRWTS